MPVRRPYTDYTGVRFGQLVGEEYLGASVWRWRCDCGNTRDLRPSELKLGRAKMCRTCSKTEGRRPTRTTNIKIGDKFGKLIVSKLLSQGRFECLCECGHTTVLRGGQLKRHTQCAVCDLTDKLQKTNK